MAIFCLITVYGAVLNVSFEPYFDIFATHTIYNIMNDSKIVRDKYTDIADVYLHGVFVSVTLVLFVLLSFQRPMFKLH